MNNVKMVKPLVKIPMMNCLLDGR